MSNYYIILVSYSSNLFGVESKSKRMKISKLLHELISAEEIGENININASENGDKAEGLHHKEFDNVWIASWSEGRIWIALLILLLWDEVSRSL